MFRIVLPFLLVTSVLCTYGGGGYRSGGYVESDCGGSCGGGCSGAYSSPCNSAPVVQYQSSGCDSGDCGGGGSYGGGSSSRYSSGHSSSAGYHKTVTTVTKETRNDHLKIVVGKPVVHRTTYVQSAPQPVYVEPAPQPVYKTQRYVDSGSDYSGCEGPCGGGSKIVKIIKKTTYSSGGDGGVCTTCEVDGGGSYSSNIEYSQPVVQPIVRKVTRIVTQPKIVRVVKTSVVQPVVTSGEYYENSSSGSNYGGGHGGKRYSSGGGGYGGGRSKAFAFASASASAGAGAGAGSGDYVGGGGSGCKSGCDEWKK